MHKTALKCGTGRFNPQQKLFVWGFFFLIIVGCMEEKLLGRIYSNSNPKRGRVGRMQEVILCTSYLAVGWWRVKRQCGDS